MRNKLALALLLITSGKLVGTSNELLLAIRAKGAGMTWMAAQEYSVLIRADGTVAYTALANGKPMLRITHITESKVEAISGLARKLPPSSVSKGTGFTDCSLRIKITGLLIAQPRSYEISSCDLNTSEEGLKTFVCTVDSIRAESDGGIDEPTCAKVRTRSNR